MPRTPIRSIRTEGDTAYVLLNTGKEVMIDAADAHLVVGVNWTELGKAKTSYAVRSALVDGKRKTLLLHRVLMSPPVGLHVDHKNGDGLDNRRCNLRLATPSQNRCNTSRLRKNKVGYKGVHQHPITKRFAAYIGHLGKIHYLGTHATAEDAYAAYCKAARELHGDFACVA